MSVVSILLNFVYNVMQWIDKSIIIKFLLCMHNGPTVTENTCMHVQ